jgi:hypothetical protein
MNVFRAILGVPTAPTIRLRPGSDIGGSRALSEQADPLHFARALSGFRGTRFTKGVAIGFMRAVQNL